MILFNSDWRADRRGLLRVPRLFPYHGARYPFSAKRSSPAMATKLSRKQLREALDTVPTSVIFGKEVNRELTPKQRKFALEVAKGNTKADAYRAAYNVKSKATMAGEPYRVAADPRVAAEIAAIERAIRAQEYQSPSALRALVINSLVQVITDPDAKPGQIVNAAKVLGSVTEVAAFTERKEVRTISSSEDARAQVMAQLREIIKAQAEDAHVIDAAADSLLAELANPAAPHPAPTPHDAQGTPAESMHTIPPERSAPIPSSQISSPEDPHPSSMGTPPLDGT